MTAKQNQNRNSCGMNEQTDKWIGKIGKMRSNCHDAEKQSKQSGRLLGIYAEICIFKDQQMQQHNDTDNAVSCAENQTVQRHKYKAKADGDGNFEQINQNMPPFFLCGFALTDYLLRTRLIEL